MLAVSSKAFAPINWYGVSGIAGLRCSRGTRALPLPSNFIVAGLRFPEFMEKLVRVSYISSIPCCKLARLWLAIEPSLLFGFGGEAALSFGFGGEAILSLGFGVEVTLSITSGVRLVFEKVFFAYDLTELLRPLWQLPASDADEVSEEKRLSGSV